MIGLLSCTSNDDIASSEENEQNTGIQTLYNAYKINAQKGIETTMAALNAPKSRATSHNKVPGLVLVEYLASLSNETVDSLYNQYCNSEENLKYDNYTDSLISVLVEGSSLEEVQNLFNFTNSYIENGGHNMAMLSASASKASPIIKNCIISCAANIDEFSDISSQSLPSESWCLRQLALKMAESSVMNGIADVVGDIAVDMIGIPGVDVAGALILLGYDLYSSIEMAHDYKMCCLTHLS